MFAPFSWQHYRLLAAVEILRRREGMSGCYIHVKMLPGSDDEQVRQAVKLASRILINLEGRPTQWFGVWPWRRISLEISCRSSAYRVVAPAGAAT